MAAHSVTDLALIDLALNLDALRVEASRLQAETKAAWAKFRLARAAKELMDLGFTKTEFPPRIHVTHFPLMSDKMPLPPEIECHRRSRP